MIRYDSDIESEVSRSFQIEARAASNLLRVVLCPAEQAVQQAQVEEQAVRVRVRQ
jgi:hypothetical protein